MDRGPPQGKPPRLAVHHLLALLTLSLTAAAGQLVHVAIPDRPTTPRVGPALSLREPRQMITFMCF